MFSYVVQQKVWRMDEVKSRNIAGFTLIELLIVVAIIGILAAIAVPNFLNAQERAKVSRAEADIRSLATALEMYRLDNNDYPWFRSMENNPLGTFFLLTTPISYMASIPYEVFPPENTQYFGNVLKVAYMYTDRRSYGEQGWFSLHDTKGQYKYVVRSMGPDRSANIVELPASPDLILPYDMSNGLASRGDICRYGP